MSFSTLSIFRISLEAFHAHIRSPSPSLLGQTLLPVMNYILCNVILEAELSYRLGGLRFVVSAGVVVEE